jgi:hypothetical protein
MDRGEADCGGRGERGRLVRGRERVFGLSTSVGEISAAFGPGPVARIGLGDGDGGEDRGQGVVDSLWGFA